MDRTEEAFMGAVCIAMVVAVLALIGGCTYNERKATNEKFRLEQQQMELTAQGKPTKLEVVVHKLDDEQFKELIQVIKEKP